MLFIATCYNSKKLKDIKSYPHSTSKTLLKVQVKTKKKSTTLYIYIYIYIYIYTYLYETVV